MSAPPTNIIPNPNSARYGAAVVTSDTASLKPTAGLWVGGPGNVTVEMAGDGGSALFPGVSAGTMLPISVTRVMATGTTATLITAVWN